MNTNPWKTLKDASASRLARAYPTPMNAVLVPVRLKPVVVIKKVA